MNKFFKKIRNDSLRNNLASFSFLLMMISIFSYPDVGSFSYVSRILFVFSALFCCINKRIKFTKIYFFCFFIFVLLCLVNIVFSCDKELTISTSVLTFQALGIAFVFYFWLNAFKEYRTVIFSCALSIIPFIIRASKYYLSTSWGNRRYSYLFEVNTNSWGARLSLAIVFCIVAFYYSKSRISKLLFIATGVASGILILITGSRRALLLGALSFGILLLGHNNKPIKRLKIILVILSSLIVVVYLVLNIPSFYTIIGSRLEEFVTSLMSKEFELGGQRDEMIEEGIRLFLKKPFTGWGLGTFEIASGLPHPYCHNNYVELLFALGIFGFLSYYFLFIYIAWRLCVIRKEKRQLSFSGSLLAYLLITDFVTVDYTSLLTQVIIALLLSISCLNKGEYIEELIKETDSKCLG